MKVGVYDRYWPTMGGGEVFAGAIARALTHQGHAVELLGFEPVARDVMHDRLGIDPDIPMVLVANEHAVSMRSSGYDLFVNATYLSSAINLAPRGVFVVHFPGSRPSRRERIEGGLDAAWRQTNRGTRLRWADGVHPPEDGGRVAWTNGFARLLAWFPSKGQVRFMLSSRHWPPGSRVDVLVKAGPSTLHHGLLEADAPVEIVVSSPERPTSRPVPIVIASDSFVPAQTFGTVDDRQLGIQVTDVEVDGRPRTLTSYGARRGAGARSYLDTYDQVVANSSYTARWMEELWGRSCEVLHPPVRAPMSGRKEPMILAVGRFFDTRRGHSKKQLEMVRAFRALMDRGVRGWSLHLVGGCSPADRTYAMAVKREALGLPVSVYFNASQERLDDLYARAALFWHATGYGERLERHPDRFEHFGVSVAEAVTAGCVPLVYALGGPAEMVADVPEAHRWHSLDELVSQTAMLADAHDRGALGRPSPLAGSMTFEWFSARLDELASSA